MKPFKLSLIHINDTFDITNIKEVYNTFSTQEINNGTQQLFDSLQQLDQIKLWHYIFVRPFPDDIKDILNIIEDFEDFEEDDDLSLIHI